MASHPLLSHDPTHPPTDDAKAPFPPAPLPPSSRSNSDSNSNSTSDSEDDDLQADFAAIHTPRPGLKRRRTGWLEYQRLTTRHVLLGSALAAVLLVVVGTLASLTGAGGRVGRWEYRPPMDPSKRAVMIEKRNLPNLVPLLHDFIVKVPPEWSFQVWCGRENEPIMRKSRLLAPYIASGKLNLTRLPDEDAIYNGATLSKFLTAPWFWQQLAPAEHIFFFQLDSVICAQSNASLNDFIGEDAVPGGYAWLGAPWFQYGLVPEGEMYGGNGGFSLRRRSAMLDITSSSNWTEGNEDMWFADHIRDSGGKWHMAQQNVAMHFAYETPPEDARKFNWVHHPFGVHTGSVWMTCYFERFDDVKRLLEWCPESKMIISHHCLQ